MLHKKTKNRSFFLSNRLVWFDNVAQNIGSVIDDGEGPDSKENEVGEQFDSKERLTREEKEGRVNAYLDKEEKTDAEFEVVFELFLSDLKHFLKTEEGWKFMLHAVDNGVGQAESILNEMWNPLAKMPERYVEVFRIVAEQYPDVMAWCYTWFWYTDPKKADGKKEVLEYLIEKSPSSIVKSEFMYRYTVEHKKIFKRAAYACAEKQPSEAIRFFKGYSKYPYAKDVLTLAATNDPIAAVQYFKAYAETIYANDIFKYAVHEGGKLKDKKLVWLVSKFEEIEGAEQIIATIFKEEPHEALKLYKEKRDELSSKIKGMLVNALRTKEVMTKAIKAVKTDRDARPLLGFMKDYKEEDFVEKRLEAVLFAAGQYAPGAFLEYYEALKDEEHPDYLLFNAVMNAVRIAPTAAVKYYDIYKDKSELFRVMPANLYEAAKRRKLVFDSLKREREDGTLVTVENTLMSDHALKWVEDIERSWLPSELTDKEFGNYVALIARNLYFDRQYTGRWYQKKMIVSEYGRILSQREQYKDIPLFQGRNIILASNLERWWNGEDRFGKKTLVSALKKEQGKGYKFKHFEPSERRGKSLQKTKQDTLRSLANTPSPLTFIFDGHVGEKALYFSDGQIDGEDAGVIETKDTIKITVKELAEALLQRDRGTISQDILIFNGCHNNKFTRKLYAILMRERPRSYDKDKKQIVSTLPIAIGVAEYGQLAYSIMDSKYGALFFDKVLNLDKGGVNFSRIWQNEEESDSNVWIFIPTGKKYIQITENTESRNNDSAPG